MKKADSGLPKSGLHYYKKPSVEIINFVYDDIIRTSGCIDRHGCPTNNSDDIRDLINF